MHHARSLEIRGLACGLIRRLTGSSLESWHTIYGQKLGAPVSPMIKETGTL